MLQNIIVPWLIALSGLLAGLIFIVLLIIYKFKTPPNKIITSIYLVLILIMIFWIGRNSVLPYIPSSLVKHIVWYFIAPALALLTAYLLFRNYSKKQAQKNAQSVAIRTDKNFIGFIKSAFWSLFILFFTAIFIPFMLLSTPGLATFYFAKEPFTKEVVIINVSCRSTNKSSTARTIFYYMDVNTKIRDNFFFTGNRCKDNPDFAKSLANTKAIIQGRTWILGEYVERLDIKPY